MLQFSNYISVKRKNTFFKKFVFLSERPVFSFICKLQLDLVRWRFSSFFQISCEFFVIREESCTKATLQAETLPFFHNFVFVMSVIELIFLLKLESQLAKHLFLSCLRSTEELGSHNVNCVYFFYPCISILVLSCCSLMLISCDTDVGFQRNNTSFILVSIYISSW